jgi:FPC/CPF motif-containing protein YcgG
LADDPDHSKTLQEMRKNLNRWIRDTGDLGQDVESMKMYDSDMKVISMVSQIWEEEIAMKKSSQI